MSFRSVLGRICLVSIVAAVLEVSSSSSQAVTILSEPSFTKAVNAPLAGTLHVATDIPSRVSVSINDGAAVWQRDFFDYGTNHFVPLYGFKPDRVNDITVTVRDKQRNEFTAPDPVQFITSPLPSTFPPYTVFVNQVDRMEPGYTLFRVVNNNASVAYTTLMDNEGNVVWYASGSQVETTLEVKQLANGNLFIPIATNFNEVNLLGEVVKKYVVPNNIGINFHEGLLTDHDTILYINDDTRTVANFPTSSTNPNAPKQTTALLFNRIIEMSASTGALLNNWSVIDMIDPLRINYLTFTIRNSLGWDCEHVNAVIEDPRDNSIIVSMRHQDAVIKFTRDGQLKWILGPHENWKAAFQPYLLTPVGAPFEWNYAQHAPVITPQGTLLMYDDGDYRASPFDTSVADAANYSRAVEYSIDEQAMTVRQVWEYASTDAPLYTDRVGNADWLPRTGNVLVDFGNIDYEFHAHPSSFAPNAAMLRIKEVTHDTNATPEVVFDVSFFDYTNHATTYKGNYAYRAHRVPDLYGHPAAPVTDLNLSYSGSVAHLQFSADPVRNYSIEASSDLENWTEIGTPEPEADGNYDFEDVDMGDNTARYYRVVTH